ncbi:MAG: RNA polymerase sigma factor [Phycisphaerales bacterium]
MGETENPLQSSDPGEWDRLMQAVNPASLLVAVQMRLGPALAARYQPEDILQEALFSAWRDRLRHNWTGVRGFRAWLLTTIEFRIRDLADHVATVKRGGRAFQHSLSVPETPEIIQSTTASRIAGYRQEASAVLEALRSLPVDQADLIRLRLIEQMTIPDIARHLSLGESAVQHRFRKAAEAYQTRLAAISAQRLGSTEQNRR